MFAQRPQRSQRRRVFAQAALPLADPRALRVEPNKQRGHLKREIPPQLFAPSAASARTNTFKRPTQRPASPRIKSGVRLPRMASFKRLVVSGKRSNLSWVADLCLLNKPSPSNSAVHDDLGRRYAQIVKVNARKVSGNVATAKLDSKIGRKSSHKTFFGHPFCANSISLLMMCCIAMSPQKAKRLAIAAHSSRQSRFICSTPIGLRRFEP